MEPMDNTDQLVNYIIQQRRQGISEPQIHDILIQAGWPQHTIDKAFEFIEELKRASPAEYQTPQVSLPDISTATEPIPLTKNSPQRAPKSGRKLIVTIIIIALLAAIVGAAIVFTSNNDTDSPQSTTPKTTPRVNLDEPRKETLGKLADKLVAYYKANGTYPTQAALNTLTFKDTKEGFDVNELKDPEWNKDIKACTDTAGRAITAVDRTDGCFTYRVTATNGADCDANATPCNRAVLVANMHDKKPLIIVLDKDQKQIQ